MPKMTQFRLLLSGPEFSRVYKIGPGKTTIGRQPGIDILLENSLVSRHHAMIELMEGEVQLTDLESSNGTRLNGERLTPNVAVKLKESDLFEIGPYQFRLEVQIIPEPAPISPKEEIPKLPQDEIGTGAELPEHSPSLAGIPVLEGSVGEAPPPPEPPVDSRKPELAPTIPPGLSIYSQRLMNYLPAIYHSEFMSRLLGLFESILLPLEWTIDNFDLYLAANTSPPGFLPWLARWFEITFDSSWDERQRREYLNEAYSIYSRQGTRWALNRVLEIFTGCTPEIIDNSEDLQPFEFLVRLKIDERKVNRRAVEALIEAHKPAHTHFLLEFNP